MSHHSFMSVCGEHEISSVWTFQPRRSARGKETSPCRGSALPRRVDLLPQERINEARSHGAELRSADGRTFPLNRSTMFYLNFFQRDGPSWSSVQEAKMASSLTSAALEIWLHSFAITTSSLLISPSTSSHCVAILCSRFAILTRSA